MKIFPAALAFLPLLSLGAENPAPQFDAHAAERFARLALACVDKEYPNKISHVLNSDADVAPPRQLTPAFCGCYDWHSSVHGHWLLARLARTFPDAVFPKEARAALARSLTSANIKQEVAYLDGKGRASFERPTGLSGCSSCAPNCANGTIRWRVNCRPICARSRMSRWSICRTGCRNFPIRCASGSTIKLHSRSG